MLISLADVAVSDLASDALAGAAAHDVPGRVVKVEPSECRLGRTVTISVHNLSNLLARSESEQRGLALFINGVEIPDSPLTTCDFASQSVSFELRRTQENAALWQPILKYPLERPSRPVVVSVGLRNGMPLPVSPVVGRIRLVVVELKLWTIMWSLLFVVLLVICLLLAAHSELLRAPNPSPDGRYPYSLGRTQAAFWMFLTTMSFVFIWVVTGDLATLNPRILVLLGISSATALSSMMLDSKSSNPPAQAEGMASTTAGPGLPAQTPQLRPLVTRLQSTAFVGHFLVDILSDDSGVSIHRFQIFVWTIVLGVIFAVSVLNELAMPVFSDTLLALMGISSATFLAAKVVK